MPLVQIFILTYNRPSHILGAVQSALNQRFNSFVVIVSDNSTNNDSKELISKIRDDHLVYKRRKPSLSALDHFNVILQEVTSEYFVIFHDDDVMHPNMIDALYNGFNESIDVAAVGANAIIARDGKITNKKIFRNSERNLVLRSSMDVVKQYIVNGGIVPFSSYMYKLSIAKNLRFDLSKGGKYCDAAFIMDVTVFGDIVFLANPVMDYNIHGGQDSSSYSFGQASKLIKYFSKKTGLDRNSKLIKKFRVQNIYVELKHGLQNGKIRVLSRRYISLFRVMVKTCNVEYSLKILILSFASTFWGLRKKLK